MMNRFERRRSGEFAALWYEAASMKQAKKSNGTMEALASRAKTLCLQGQFSRAAKISSLEGIATDNRKTPTELKKLHSEENEILEPLEGYSCEAYQFDKGKVLLQLQSFSKVTAAGPSKMYPEHPLHAINCSISDQSKRKMNFLTKLVNFASRGQLPSFVAPAFCSATLTALNKKKTGIRPIAVGEVIRRLVAKCIAKEAAIEAVELFGSKQLGVAVKGGAESIVHATKITFERMKRVKNGGILQTDFSNAFNSVKRSHLLGSAKVLMPSINSFASFCYSKHSDLFFNSSTVDSQTGVQQGDPLGPLLFSFDIWPLIGEIESKIPNRLQHCWYLDDGIIAETEIELCKALEILSLSGEIFVLELRKNKCELWSIESMTKIDSLIKRNCLDGIESLGAAIGSDAFVSSCLPKSVKKLEEHLDNLAYADNPQCVLGILRFCFGAPKKVYSLRCNSPSDESNKIVRKFDSIQRATSESILGVLFSDTSWDQACLPINKTGVGIRRSADQVQAAYVGSFFQSSVLVEKLTGHNPTEVVSFVEAVE